MRLKEDRKQNYSFRSIMKRRWRTPLQEYWKRIITGQADIIVSVFMTVNWTIENMMRCFIIRLRKTQRRRQWNWH